MNEQSVRRSQRRKGGVILGVLIGSGLLWLGWGMVQTMQRLRMNRPLIAACENGRYAAVKDLLDQGADPNAVPGIDISRLSLMDRVRLLLHRPLSMREQPNTRNALFWAVARGHADIVKLLLERGADVNRTFQYGETIIAKAASDGNIPILRLLTEHGANLNSRPSQSGLIYFWSPLDLAAMHGKTDSIRFLLEHGADPNFSAKKGSWIEDTPLMWATIKECPSCVRLLIEHGADVNYKSPRGATSLNWARSTHSKVIEKMLLDAGAKR